MELEPNEEGGPEFESPFYNLFSICWFRSPWRNLFDLFNILRFGLSCLQNVGHFNFVFLTTLSFRSHRKMVKAVVVLNSKEGVSGTIYFAEEDGN